MNGRQILLNGLVLALLAILAVASSQALGAGQMAGDQPEGAQVPAQVVWPSIPIQGRLTDANGRNVADGDYVVTFRLYDALEGGELLWDDTIAVHVADGLFATYISASGYIDGRPLYLGVQVQGDEEMVPRQPIYPVPYALSLRPGAHVICNADFALHLENTSEEPHTYTLVVVSNEGSGVLAHSENGVGVRAVSSQGIGIDSSSSDGKAIVGRSENGYAGYFFGDVAQTLSADGLVKAAAYANCSGISSSILRSFNHVDGTVTMSISDQTDGRCTIDWGFDIRGRYFVATAFSSGTGSAARGVSCEWGSEDEWLDCFRWNADGNPANGKIMVLIY